jgi:hypothetical protein
MEAVAVTGLIPVAMLLPLWLVSLAIFWLILRVWVEIAFWWFPLGWLLLGSALFLRPIQVAILTPLLGARRPSDAETEILQPVWTELTRVLDLPANRFVLRVLPADELNAFASGGHLVVVTTYAIEQLEDRDLAGVLAHELTSTVAPNDEPRRRILARLASIGLRFTLDAQEPSGEVRNRRGLGGGWTDEPGRGWQPRTSSSAASSSSAEQASWRRSTMYCWSATSCRCRCAS